MIKKISKMIFSFSIIFCVVLFCSACTPMYEIGKAILVDDNISIYDRILNSIKEGETEIFFENVDESEIEETFISVLDDHPELFWVSRGFSYQKIVNEDVSDILLIMNNNEELRAKTDYFNKTVENIISAMGPFQDQYDAIIKIHDYILDNTEYDNDAFNEIQNNADIKKVYNETTAYGCICEGKAICSGYSAAMQLLLNKAGIESGVIYGEKIGGSGHQWNYVKIGDDYYYIDVTWDDTVSYEGRKCYDYFCITTDELLKTHIIGENSFIPDCNSTTYNYYIYNNMYLEKYDYNSAANIIINSGGTIKFSTKEEADIAYNDLVNNKKIYQILSVNQIAYSSSGDGTVLHFIY